MKYDVNAQSNDELQVVQNTEQVVHVEWRANVMQHDSKTKNNDGRIGAVFGMDIQLRVGYSCRMEVKYNGNTKSNDGRISVIFGNNVEIGLVVQHGG